MIMRSLEDRVLSMHGESGLVLPRYDGHSLPNVPETVYEMLTGQRTGRGLEDDHTGGSDAKGASKVVLFYIDGMSYDFLAGRGKDAGFFGRMIRKGTVSPITAVFPTTTAASCTSLNTGLSPLEHNLLEWELYFHETGALIYTLPFRAVTSRYSSRARDLDSSVLFTGESIYSRLQDKGVKSYVLVNKVISRGAYSDRVFEGSTVVPYSYITDCIIQLRRILEGEKGPLYVYVYIESADSVAHTYGPETEMYVAETESISRIVRHELLDKIDPVTADDVSVIMTSDHGVVQVDPRETLYLDSMKGLWNNLEVHMGREIPPVGSPRDLFLHVKENRLSETESLLDSKLGDSAYIIRVDEAVRSGFFGSGVPSGKFYSRAGNLMILPSPGNTVWYRLKGQIPMRLRGLHGGMTRDEMIIPFGIARLSHLL